MGNIRSIILKRIIITSIVIFSLFASVVSGSSINGEYKGNSIVKVMVNGTEIQSDVPGINFDGSTLVPLRAITEAMGASVEWIGDKQLASIQFSPPTPFKDQKRYVIEDMRIISDAIYTGLMSDNFSGVENVGISIEQDKTSISIVYNTPKNLSFTEVINNTIVISSVTAIAKDDYDIDVVRITMNTSDGYTAGEITIDYRDILRFTEGRITKDQYTNLWKVKSFVN
jgi:hypothetical protein